MRAAGAVRCGSLTGPHGPGQGGGMPTPPTEADVLSYHEKLSNWGRWGPEDQLGTLNLITPQTRRSAAALVREGISVSCAWDLDTMPQEGDVFGPVHRFMV